MLEPSVQQIAYQERGLGLTPCRVNLHTRCVRYHAGPALAALKARNMLPMVDEPDSRADPHPTYLATPSTRL